MLDRIRFLPLILPPATLIIYFLSHRHHEASNYFVLLADAFLNGRLFLLTNPPWLNELVSWHGHYFVVYPPMPAILLMPFVAVFGANFYQPVLSWLLSAVNVGLAYFVFLKLFKKGVAWWGALLYAFGSMQWYHGSIGSAWYLGHIVALFFLWLAVLEAVTKRRLILIGLLIGAAFLARLPTLFSAIFFFIYFWDKRALINFRNFFLLTIGFLPILLFYLLYNYLRFGTIDNLGYLLLPVFNEPWYGFGLLSVNYIPVHLKEMFFAMPIFSARPPFIIPSLFVMAIWIVTPAYFLVLWANLRKRLSLASFIASAVIAIPILMHGGNGLTQFGYRYTMDFMPFIFFLTLSGMRDKVSLRIKLLVLASIAVNIWGIIMIDFLGIWGWW